MILNSRRSFLNPEVYFYVGRSVESEEDDVGATDSPAAGGLPQD